MEPRLRDDARDRKGEARVRAARASSITPCILAAGCLALSIYGLWWALPNTSEPDPDSSVPLTTLRGASCGFADGWVGQHQPLHPMLIATLSAPYLGYLMVTGGLEADAVKRAYPYGLTDPETSLSVVILIGRLLSAVAYLVLVWVSHRTGALLGGPRVGAVLAALAATCYPFVYYAHVGNPDMLYTTLLAIALLAYLQSLRAPSVQNIAVLASAAALSASVKIQVLPFVVGMAPAVLYACLVGQGRGLAGCPVVSPPLQWRALVAGALIFIATFAAANNLMFNADGFQQWLRGKREGVSIAQRSSEREQRTTGGPGFAVRTTRNLSDGMGLPVVAAAVLGLILGMARRRGETAALMLPLAAYAVFYWKVHADFIRYMFPGMLVLLVFAALGLEALREPLWRTRAGRVSAVLVAALLLGYLGIRAASITYLMTHGSRVQAERWIVERAAGQPATVEIHEPANLRLPDTLRLAAFDAYTYHTRERAGADPRKHHPYGWSVPEEVTDARAVRRRAPRFLVLLPGEGRDDALIEEMSRRGSGYSRVAAFGGPTLLIRQPLFTNVPLVIFEREGPSGPG